MHIKQKLDLFSSSKYKMPVFKLPKLDDKEIQLPEKAENIGIVL